MNARIGTKSLTRSRWLVASALSVSLLAYGLAVVPSAEGAQPAKQAAAKSPTRPASLHRAATLLDPSTSPCTVVGTDVTCELFARQSAGAVTWPSAPSVAGVPFWSYTSTDTDPVGATGPTLVVKSGDTVHLNLHNRLGAGHTTALSIPQLEGLDADVVGIDNGLDKQYNFTATRPGTYIYQAGGTPEGSRQAAMGMVGALVVLPSAAADAGTAYGAGTGTDYTDDSVVLLTDVDPALNADPTGYDLRGYTPQLHLLNGAPYPATTNINATPGGKVLLRIINGGIIQHALGVLGTNQEIVGQSSRLLNNQYGVAVEKISAGDTLDMLVNVPDQTAGPLFPIYDSSSRLDNSSGPASGPVPFGGALAFINNGATSTSNAGPVVTGLDIAVPTIGTATDLAFTGIAGKSGDADITSVEYTIDDGSAITGTAFSGVAGPAPLSLSGTVPASVINTLTSGSHTLFVRATNSAGTGPWASIAFNYDNVGPTTALALDPTATNAGDLTITGTASDSSTGGSGVGSVEGFVDGVSIGQLTVTTSGDVTLSIDGAITASTLNGLSQGEHTLTAKATDTLLNLGPASDGVKFIVDRTGPVVSAVYVNPSPNNGSQGSANDPTNIEVRAWFADPGPVSANGKTSGVVDGEAFLGTTTRTNGAGFPLFPYTPPGGGATVLVGYIPVSELTKYAMGTSVDVAVHARDAAGNWGDYKVGSLILSLDLIFASDFDSIPGLVPPWARFAQTVGGGLTGSNTTTIGTNHAFVVTRNTANADTANSLSFLVDASPSAETSYNVAFDFASSAAGANGFTAGTSANTARVFTIFQARNALGRTAYSVEFRAYKPNGTVVREVQLRVRTGNGNGSRVTGFVRLPTTGTVRIHVSWTSATNARPTFAINGATQTMSAINTTAFVVDTALLGVSANADTVIQPTVTPPVAGNLISSGGTLWFDNFNSARVTKP
jgi:FtsP/CotA-like multicopper oxidase with cupredoxin domain